MAITAMAARAGDRLTADGFNRAQGIYSWKLAAKSITSSTTEQADEELWLPLEPLSTYEVLACFSVTGGTTGDVKISYSVPTGTQGRRHTMGLSTGTTGTSWSARAAVHGWTTSVSYGTGVSSISIIEEGVITTEATGGIMQVQWAQNTSNGTATTMEAGSFLRIGQVMG